MKKAIVAVVGVMFMVSCGPKPGTAPSGADVLVLTQPAGAVPGNLSAIETSTGKVYDDILPGGTGEIPNEIYLKNSILYIVNSAQGSLQEVQVGESSGKLSLSTLGRVFLPAGSYPEYMEFVGERAYITLFSSNSLGVVDTSRNLFTGEIKFPPNLNCSGWPDPKSMAPWGIAKSGTSLIVAGSGVSPGAVVWVDSLSGSITFSAATSGGNASSIAVDSTEGRVYVTSSDWCSSMNGALDTYTTGGRWITGVSLGAPLGWVAIADGKAYVADLGAPILHIVDLATFEQKSVPLTSSSAIGFVTGVRVSPKGLVYACGWGVQGGEVYQVDPSTDTVTKTYAIKGPAQDVAFRY